MAHYDSRVRDKGVRSVLREIEKRIINSFMDIVVLFALYEADDSSSGYDLIKHIYGRFRFLPSCGTIYANLYALERDGLIKGMQENRRRVYCLTSKGYERLHKVERANGNIQRIVETIFAAKGITVPQLP